MSMQRTIRRGIDNVGHYGRGGRSHLQDLDILDVDDHQRKAMIKRNCPVKGKTINKSNAARNTRVPKFKIEKGEDT